MNMNDSTWVRTSARRVKQGDMVKVSWWVNDLRFIAAGTVEERPHRLDPESGDDRIRLKIAAGDRVLIIEDATGRNVTDTEAGFLWDGWLFPVHHSVDFFRPAD